MIDGNRLGPGRGEGADLVGADISAMQCFDAGASGNQRPGYSQAQVATGARNDNQFFMGRSRRAAGRICLQKGPSRKSTVVMKFLAV
jgi:hypothetical protein